jgi:hypothetical protein
MPQCPLTGQFKKKADIYRRDWPLTVLSLYDDVDLFMLKLVSKCVGEYNKARKKEQVYEIGTLGTIPSNLSLDQASKMMKLSFNLDSICLKARIFY